MRIGSLVAAATIGFMMLLVHGVMVDAAEIKVLSTNAVTAVLDELGPVFERETGHKLVIHYDVANILRNQILAGEQFDVAIVTGPATEELLKQGKLAAGSRGDIARSGVGVAVRAGAPKPDISTAEAFKRTMLAAKSVAYTTQGASGIYFTSVLQRLGIAEEMKSKSKVQQGGSVGEVVAKGEAELAVQQISELLRVPGIELVGPFPPALQNFTLFSAGVSAGAKEPEAAQTLIKFLTAPSALPVIKAKGMEPPA
jgi:molybdate transport system substrate-binding protein